MNYNDQQLEHILSGLRGDIQPSQDGLRRALARLPVTKGPSLRWWAGFALVPAALALMFVLRHPEIMPSSSSVAVSQQVDRELEDLDDYLAEDLLEEDDLAFF